MTLQLTQALWKAMFSNPHALESVFFPVIIFSEK